MKMEDGEQIQNAHLLCTDGFTEAYGLIDGFSVELERVEIPGWLEQYEDLEEIQG